MKLISECKACKGISIECMQPEGAKFSNSVHIILRYSDGLTYLTFLNDL